MTDTLAVPAGEAKLAEQHQVYCAVRTEHEYRLYYEYRPYQGDENRMTAEGDNRCRRRPGA
jgi:hypothetical protein